MRYLLLLTLKFGYHKGRLVFKNYSMKQYSRRRYHIFVQWALISNFWNIVQGKNSWKSDRFPRQGSRNNQCSASRISFLVAQSRYLSEQLHMQQNMIKHELLIDEQLHTCISFKGLSWNSTTLKSGRLLCHITNPCHNQVLSIYIGYNSLSI